MRLQKPGNTCSANGLPVRQGGTFLFLAGNQNHLTKIGCEIFLSSLPFGMVRRLTLGGLLLIDTNKGTLTLSGVSKLLQ